MSSTPAALAALTYHHLPLLLAFPRIALPHGCFQSTSSRAPSLTLPSRRTLNGVVRCEVAVEVSSQQDEEESESSKLDKVGSRVRVKVPLKVYHVPKVADLHLNGMEGEIKQYVSVWSGKRISANLPFKVEFFTEVEGRGKVKFFAHLKEDEFEFV